MKSRTVAKFFSWRQIRNVFISAKQTKLLLIFDERSIWSTEIETKHIRHKQNRLTQNWSKNYGLHKFIFETSYSKSEIFKHKIAFEEASNFISHNRRYLNTRFYVPGRLILLKNKKHIYLFIDWKMESVNKFDRVFCELNCGLRNFRYTLGASQVFSETNTAVPDRAM